jgi:hypothetical protein
MECPICKGTKVTTMTVETYGIKGSEKVEIECPGCHGTGEVSSERMAQLTQKDNIWCECEEDHGVDYWGDGEHPDLSKHHYRCKKCKKVVQIG